MARIYIPVEIDRRVRNAARNRCGYCLSPQHLVMARLEIEHILPISICSFVFSCLLKLTPNPNVSIGAISIRYCSIRQGSTTQASIL
jgi:hypothetical protein